IIRRPASEAVARFFGGVNFLDGRVEGSGLHCALGLLPMAEPGPPGPARVTIRPEAVRLHDGPGPVARVVGVTFLGTQSRVELTQAGQSLTALVQPSAAEALHPGDTVAVSLPPEALWRLPD
ncbi:MAG: TOBE domain-containing protein, partial [Paracoccaceae bacterium]|nr:TOBE domain-containing protein [Paracoccaceae bacterium]